MSVIISLNKSGGLQKESAMARKMRAKELTWLEETMAETEPKITGACGMSYAPQAVYFLLDDSCVMLLGERTLKGWQ